MNTMEGSIKPIQRKVHEQIAFCEWNNSEILLVNGE